VSTFLYRFASPFSDPHIGKQSETAAVVKTMTYQGLTTKSALSCLSLVKALVYPVVGANHSSIAKRLFGQDTRRMEQIRSMVAIESLPYILLTVRV